MVGCLSHAKSDIGIFEVYSNIAKRQIKPIHKFRSLELAESALCGARISTIAIKKGNEIDRVPGNCSNLDALGVVIQLTATACQG